MDIGRVQRRFTAEPVESPVPAAPAAPLETVETREPVQHRETETVTADTRS